MLMSDENLKQGTCITNPNYGIMNPEKKKKSNAMFQQRVSNFLPKFRTCQHLRLKQAETF